MTNVQRGVARVLFALALWFTPVFGAELRLSQDVAIHGEDVVGQLARPVTEMEEALAQRGCHAFTRAYWSDITPLRTLHVEVRCTEASDEERLGLR